MKQSFLGFFLILFSVTLCAQENTLPNAPKLKRGGYYDVSEFLSNEPGMQDSFYVASKPRSQPAWIGTNSPLPMYNKTGKKVKKIWGFCDGEVAYIHFQEDYFPIVSKNGKHTFVGYDLTNNSGGYPAMVVGGLIGYAVYSTVADGQAKRRKIEYTIDTLSGLALHPERKEVSVSIASKKSVPKYAVLILYRKSAGESDLPMAVAVGDSLYSLVPNAYKFIRLDENISPVKVCYGPGYSACKDIELNSNAYKYLQCSSPKKGKPPELIEVTNSKGGFESASPHKKQEKRIKKEQKRAAKLKKKKLKGK